MCSGHNVGEILTSDVGAQQADPVEVYFWKTWVLLLLVSCRSSWHFGLWAWVPGPSILYEKSMYENNLNIHDMSTWINIQPHSNHDNHVLSYMSFSYMICPRTHILYLYSVSFICLGIPISIHSHVAYDTYSTIMPWCWLFETQPECCKLPRKLCPPNSICMAADTNCQCDLYNILCSSSSAYIHVMKNSHRVKLWIDM